ncbi:MAG: hypothetical protein ACAF41_31700 [Leptolyngbya sp. BL-A-14]
MPSPKQRLPLEPQGAPDCLIKPSTKPSGVGLLGLHQRWQHFWQAFTEVEALQVWRRSDRTGRRYWQAYDPVTRQSTSSGSEADIRIWLDQHHYPQ